MKKKFSGFKIESINITKDKVKNKTYSYELDTDDWQYLFGKGNDGGVSFCKAVIKLRNEFNKGVYGNSHKIKKLISWGEDIAPMDVHQEREWIESYKKTMKEIKEKRVIE